MAHALAFVLAPEGQHPGDGCSWSELTAAQRQGVGSGVALRIFRTPSGSGESLDDLISRGIADFSGADPYCSLGGSAPCEAASSAPAGRLGVSEKRMVCDAVVPHLDPLRLWLGVYELSGAAVESFSSHPARRLEITAIRRLDLLPLRLAENETCWFYPTEDGDYLRWENQRRLETLPGFLPDLPLQDAPIAYVRADVHVLWSLMADDRALTCVGLTYGGRRIEWSVASSDPEDCATWTAFRVDNMADDTYQELSSITVFTREAGSR